MQYSFGGITDNNLEWRGMRIYCLIHGHRVCKGIRCPGRIRLASHNDLMFVCLVAFGNRIFMRFGESHCQRTH
jgi:hypothetical protein